MPCSLSRSDELEKTKSEAYDALRDAGMGFAENVLKAKENPAEDVVKDEL